MRGLVKASALVVLCGVALGAQVVSAAASTSPRSAVLALIAHEHRLMLPCRAGFGVLFYDFSMYAARSLGASELAAQGQRVVGACLQASVATRTYAQSQPHWLYRYAVVRTYLQDAVQEMVKTQAAASSIRATIVVEEPAIFRAAEGTVFGAEARTAVAERALLRSFHLGR